MTMHMCETLLLIILTRSLTHSFCKCWFSYITLHNTLYNIQYTIYNNSIQYAANTICCWFSWSFKFQHGVSCVLLQVRCPDLNSLKLDIHQFVKTAHTFSISFAAAIVDCYWNVESKNATSVADCYWLLLSCLALSGHVCCWAFLGCCSGSWLLFFGSYCYKVTAGGCWRWLLFDCSCSRMVEGWCWWPTLDSCWWRLLFSWLSSGLTAGLTAGGGATYCFGCS